MVKHKQIKVITAVNGQVNDIKVDKLSFKTKTLCHFFIYSVMAGVLNSYHYEF
jgi:hypothetical protein